MSKVLIDRELAERVCHVDNSTRQTARRELRTILAAPSGTPAMPVKAYYHEAPNEYGGLNKSVGLEVRKQFNDAPLVLESDALPQIACLEGEIAKRDEELAACRVAVENCDVFRARIAELERAEKNDAIAYKAVLERQDELRAELAATKAQGVVMPDTEDFCFCGKHVSLQMISGGASNHGYLGSVTLLIDGEYVEYTRLNAAPVQQVSVPDGWKLVPVEPTPKMIDATWYHEIDMSCGIESQGARNKRIYEAMLAAAPAAPAADAGMVEALDYQVLFDAIAAATSVYANGAVNISVQAFRDALAAHSAKGVL